MESLKPGRELDALIAEKVMGWKPPEFIDGVSLERRWKNDRGEFDSLPRYSTDIAAAWEVVEKIGLIIGKNGPVWDAQDLWDLPVYFASADTAPHAICLAALKAVGA